jgi:hypothetical protein
MIVYYPFMVDLLSLFYPLHAWPTMTLQFFPFIKAQPSISLHSYEEVGHGHDLRPIQ